MGRDRELDQLSAWLQREHPTHLALVGTGGSGKSTLAAALAHRLRPTFIGGLQWFRIGAWDSRTLFGMMAQRLSCPRTPTHIRKALTAAGPTLVILDNHEDDAATAELLEGIRSDDLSVVITARRCLLSGVYLVPTIPPSFFEAGKAQGAQNRLTRLLRHNPLALDLAAAAIKAGATPASLTTWLIDAGISRIQPIDHEDDLPEVRLLVDFWWSKLTASARRMLAVLAHCDADHMDIDSLATLAHARRDIKKSVETLKSAHLVQEPLSGRLALHAMVKHRVMGQTRFDRKSHLRHYVRLLERSPERFDLEQTHLFAAMDFAHERGDLADTLRLDDLCDELMARQTS